VWIIEGHRHKLRHQKDVLVVGVVHVDVDSERAVVDVLSGSAFAFAVKFGLDVGCLSDADGIHVLGAVGLAAVFAGASAFAFGVADAGGALAVADTGAVHAVTVAVAVAAHGGLVRVLVQGRVLTFGRIRDLMLGQVGRKGLIGRMGLEDMLMLLGILIRDLMLRLIQNLRLIHKLGLISKRGLVHRRMLVFRNRLVPKLALVPMLALEKMTRIWQAYRERRLPRILTLALGRAHLVLRGEFVRL
jgi:hypothetical protein